MSNGHTTNKPKGQQGHSRQQQPKSFQDLLSMKTEQYKYLLYKRYLGFVFTSFHDKTNTNLSREREAKIPVRYGGRKLSKTVAYSDVYFAVSGRNKEE